MNPLLSTDFNRRSLRKDGRPGERKTTATASVPMNHSLPELLVSDEVCE